MSDDNKRKDYLLAELRAAAARARCILADIENLGMALKAGEIDEDECLMLIITEGIASWCSPRLEAALQQAERRAERALWEGRVDGNGATADH